MEGIAKIIHGKICREDNIQTLFGDLVLNENTDTILKLGKIHIYHNEKPGKNIQLCNSEMKLRISLKRGIQYY